MLAAGPGTTSPAALLARAGPLLLGAAGPDETLRRVALLLAEAGGAVEVLGAAPEPIRAGAPPPPRPALISVPVPLPGAAATLRWWPARPVTDADAALAHGLAALASTVVAAHARGPSAERALGEADMARRLRDAAESLARAEDAAGVARAALETAIKILGARSGEVALLADDGLETVLALDATAPAAPPRRALDDPHPLCQAARRREPVLPGPDAAGRPLAAVPLVAGDRVLGALGLAFDAPRPLPLEAATFLDGLAALCAQAFERTRLAEAARRTRTEAEAVARRLTLLLDVSTALAAPQAYDAALETLARLAVDALGGTCTVYAQEGRHLVPRAMRGRDAGFTERIARVQRTWLHEVDAPGGLAAVHRDGRPVLVPVVTDAMLRGAARGEQHYRDLAALDMGSSMVLPLRAGASTRGVLVLTRSRDERPFTPDDLALAEELARRAGMTLENARLLRAAREAESRLENIVRSVPGVVWESWGGPDRPDQRTGFVSEHVESMLGYTVEEWLATPSFWRSIVHPDDREQAARNAAEHFVRGGHGVHEFRWVAKDGRVLDVLTHAVVVRDAEGRPIGMRGVSLDVTGSRRAEERLRLYRQIFLASQDAIAIIDREGRYLEQNEAHRRLTGYEDAELAGRTPTLHLAEEDFAAIADQLARTGQARGEYVSRHKEGARTHVDLSAFTVHDQQGAVAYHVGMKRDITHRKRVEAALRDRVREVEAYYRTADSLARATHEDEAYACVLDCIGDLLDAPRSAICLYEGDGPRFTSWRNLSARYRAAVEGHSPWPRDATDPQPVLVEDALHDPDVAAFRAVFREEGIGSLAFFPLIHQGRLAGKMMVYHDGPHRYTESERRRAATIASQLAFGIARLRAEEALRKSELWLRTIFDSLDEVVLFVQYPERVIGNVNLAVRKVFGYERDEVIGRSARILHVDDERFAEYGRRIGEAFARGEPARFEFNVLRKDGTTIPTEQTVSLLRGAGGAILGGLCVVRDLTEEKRALAELEGARRQVAMTEKLSALGSLVSGVAHEIRTPLAYITNHLFLLEQRIGRAAHDPEGDLGALHQDVARHAAAAMEGIDRINRIVGELRRFTRLKAGQRERAPLDLVVLDAVNLFRATHRGRVGVTTELRPTPDLPLDRVQVQQIVLNLLDNAADAMGRAGAVHVTTGPAEGGGAELTVTDHGTGIPPEVQARMFDPLFTTKKEGTGLGLAIVRRIVETHGGALRFDTRLGEGTTFTVHFPAPPEASANRPEALKPHAPTDEG